MLGGGGGSAPRRTLASAGRALSTPYSDLLPSSTPAEGNIVFAVCPHCPNVHSLAQVVTVRHEAAGVAAGEAVSASVPLPDQVQVPDK